ncbi:uncharacterized protein LOC114458736 isoform X2 [Gouania willdenowi]|uniref:uncharacterized protein LOC114458736 isoform X2 n=1 Tax=Gouania willdenowi TaxID=441366 RepID=UPI001055FDFB|nr:uncharacterized protein LOC114458736 isoform X2 [Gouania willdenowi]
MEMTSPHPLALMWTHPPLSHLVREAALALMTLNVYIQRFLQHDAFPSAEAHTTECGERSSTSCHKPSMTSSLSPWTQTALFSQNTLLSFTVGGVFKEVVVDDKSKESTRFSSQFQQWILVCASSTTSSSSEWLQRSRSAELLCPAPFLQPSDHPHCPTAGDAQHLLPEVRHEPGMIPEVFAGQQVGLEQSSTYLHSVKAYRRSRCCPPETKLVMSSSGVRWLQVCDCSW